eukprot:TRINITY_DN11939_c0_g1_i1.p1 TRINITY_DN11939_c0_g1~~TRINITY_DN11939_c0_g1_i1.p1  ORF type:complete len:120 (-),score=7.16 TRINITY_DN11939_c0_g1_i1:69-428(-)
MLTNTTFYNPDFPFIFYFLFLFRFWHYATTKALHFLLTCHFASSRFFFFFVVCVRPFVEWYVERVVLSFFFFHFPHLMKLHPTLSASMVNRKFELFNPDYITTTVLPFSCFPLFFSPPN